ncbi:glycosyltransferase family 39 protein [Longispora urticae]
MTDVSTAPPEVDEEEAPAAAPPAPARPGPRRAGALLALIPALGTLALALYQSGNRNMWNDELVTWHAARLSFAELRRLIVNIDLYHAFFYVLMHPWIRLAGDSPTTMRVPAAVAMALACLLIVLIGRRLTDTVTGLTAGLLFMLLPSVSRYAQEARSYALVVLGVTLATWLLLRALDRPTGLWWGLYGATLAVVGWLHFVSLMVLLGHLVWVFLTARRDDRVWQWIVTVGTAMLVVIPLFVLGSSQATAASWIKNDWPAVLKFPRQLFGTMTIAQAFGVLALVGLLLALRSRWRVALTLTLWLLVPPLVAYLTGSVLHIFLARYFFFTLPAWCLLAAMGACQLFRLPARGRMPATLGLVGGFLAVALLGYTGLPAQREVRTNAADGQPGYAGAFRFIAAHAQPTDGVAFNDGFDRSGDLARRVMNYELRDAPSRPRDMFMERTAREQGWLAAKECPDWSKCLGDVKRVWLVETGSRTDPFGGLPKSRAALMKDKFTVTRTTNLERIRVIQLDRRKP